MGKSKFIFFLNYFATCFFVWLSLSTCAQKTDYNWLSGYDSYAEHDSATDGGYQYGNIKMNFNYSPVQITYDSISMNFDFTNTTISDSNGNLLFYTNGIYVANALDETIENGDSLQAGYVIYVWNPTLAQIGNFVEQGIIALPSVTNPSQYYLFYSFTDTVPGTFTGQIYIAQIQTALLDMSANAGLGQLLYKNQPLIIDSLGGELQAVRHGNGRDWWLLVQKRSTNCFYRVLIDSTGPHVMPDLSCLGTVIPNGDVGAACFSPDGSKYVYISYYTGLSIYNFDRCTGTLSNARYLPLPVLTDSGWAALGVAISPNNRYLYVSVSVQLYQFDLTAENIFSTIDTVGIYNGTYLHGDPDEKAAFHLEQLAPNGKIYLSCGGDVQVFHVINNPDEPGDSCNFVQDGVQLPALSLCVPNYPNYRLGSLTQSQCDTLAAFTEDVRAAKEQILKVFPNPAADYTVIDYGYTDWNKGPVSLEITNALGQPVYQQQLPMYSGYQKIDISSFASGMYMAFIKRGTGVVAVAKFVKE